ncbi:MAG: hypothetical protein QM765_38790 [Myxococcales bacterium]
MEERLEDGPGHFEPALVVILRELLTRTVAHDLREPIVEGSVGSESLQCRDDG